MPRSWGKAGRAVAALGVLLSVLCVTPTAVAAPTLGIGQTATLDLDDIGVTVPLVADPRLNGYDFDAQIPAATCAAGHAGTGGQSASAPAGGQLCVFLIKVHPEEQDFLSEAMSPPAVTVVYGTGATAHTVDITLITLGNGDSEGAYAVAVPDNAPARLVLTSTSTTTGGSYSQAMDLRARVRLPPDPAVLYRATQAASLVAPVSNITASLSATRADTHGQVTFGVAVQEAALSLFAPLNKQSNFTTGNGYLIVRPTIIPTAGGSDIENVPLPAAAFTLHLPGGSTIRADGVETAGNTAATGDVFGSFVYFTVPANLTSATLNVTPHAVVKATTSGIDLATTNLTLTGTATLAITTPDQPPLHQNTSKPYNPNSPAPTTPTPRTTTGKTSGGSSVAGVLIAVIAVLIVLAIGAGVAARRSRRRFWVPARPVTSTNRALLAPTQSELLRGRAAPGLPKAPGVLGPAPLHVDPVGAAPAGQEYATAQPLSNGSGPIYSATVPGPVLVVGFLGRSTSTDSSHPSPGPRCVVCWCVWRWLAGGRWEWRSCGTRWPRTRTGRSRSTRFTRRPPNSAPFSRPVSCRRSAPGWVATS